MKLSFSYTHILVLVWALLIYYGERIYPRTVLSLCKWPKHPSWPSDAVPAHIALIGDPQIIDAHTYPGRNRVLQRISESVVDYYLRRNWVYLNREVYPDANIFMGDLFDGGREWDDDVWEMEYSRWNGIFPKPANKQTIMSLPGNHDIGYGDTIIYPAYERFVKIFGEASSTVDIGNHTIVLLDTISMLNSVNETIYNKPYEFVNELIKRPNFYQEKPRVLLTHVPLFRDPKHKCGRARESKKNLPYVRGKQYQTMVTPEVSDTILTALRPEVIFSGDDHDACYVLHNYTVAKPRASSAGTVGGQSSAPQNFSASEYTTKSFSMAMGITRPGVQLLSLYYDPNVNKNNGDKDTLQQQTTPSFATSICYTASPFKFFIIYIVFGFLTCTVIMVFNFIPEIFHPILHMIFSQRSGAYSSLASHKRASSTDVDLSLPKYATDLQSSPTSTNFRSVSAASNAPSFTAEEDSNASLKPVKQAKAASAEKSMLDSNYDLENGNGNEKEAASLQTGMGISSSNGSLLQRARFKLGSKQLWKRWAKEVAFVGVPAFTYYMFLLYSIYTVSPNKGL